jgi:signal transduction histidine kinase/CheY-like chemotaxis protein
MRGRGLLTAVLWSALLAILTTPAAAASANFDKMVAEVKADMLARPAHAIGLADRLQARAEAEPDAARRPLMRATALWLRGEAQVRVGNAAQASAILAEARRTTSTAFPNSLLLADILLAQGSALTDTGNVAEALPTLQRAHDLFLRLKQARGRAKALILLALLYEGGRDHAAALKYFAQAEDAYRGDPGLLLSIYGGRGVSLDNERRYAEAEAAFRKALKIARDLDSDTSVAPLLGNIGRMQLRRGDVAAALATIGQGLRLAERPTVRAFRPQLLMLQADGLFQMGHLRRAEELIDERFRGVDLGKTILNDRDAHETAYRIYTATGREALALRHLAALKRLDDQATEIARSTGAALMAARFDYANQELRIAKLKADDLTKSVAFERAAASTQRMIFVGVTIVTALVIALLAFGLVTLRRSRNKVRAANADLNMTNAKLEKALAAKTEFLATTSHEIRTPLNGILGMTQVMIADPALDPATRERLSVVEGAGTTMRALIDDILDVAKIETGKMTIEAVPVDVAAVVRDAARMWRDQARAKGLGFDLDVTDAPMWIVGDASRLRQITFNLLSNAVKFTPAGGVSIALAVDGARLTMTVVDTGIGIDPGAHDVIFESFRQADAGTTRQFGGTGLGLSICRNLARAMGGDVTVTSRLGDGATFTLAIPVTLAEAPDAVSERAALLVVEKNPITRATLKTILSDFHPLVFAADAVEAQAMAATRSPERILADMVSLGRNADAVATLADCAPLALLVPAGEHANHGQTGAKIVLERPISRKSLVNAVSDLTSTLVRAAA